MEARAVRKYIRSSPRKMRRVVNSIRGKNVAEAMQLLHYQPHAASGPVEKTLQSAVYNLIDQYPDERIEEEGLIIREIRVDEGPGFKRFRPAARGRAAPYKRRTSHLTVVIATADELEELDTA